MIWTDVNDEPPPDGEPVLVRFAPYVYAVGHLSAMPGAVWTIHTVPGARNIWADEARVTVTHWAEIPEPLECEPCSGPIK